MTLFWGYQKHLMLPFDVLAFSAMHQLARLLSGLQASELAIGLTFVIELMYFPLLLGL
jgi:hypothetical protein